MLNFSLRLKTSFENLDKNSLATFQKRKKKKSILLNSGCNPYMSGKATQLSSHIPWGKCVLPFLVLLKGEGRLGKNKTSIPPDKTAYGFTHMKLFLAPEALLFLCFRTRAGILLRESFRKLLLLDDPNFCWILNFWKLVLPLLFLLQNQGALQTKALMCFWWSSSSFP